MSRSFPGFPATPTAAGGASDRLLWLGGDPIDYIAVGGYDFAD